MTEPETEVTGNLENEEVEGVVQCYNCEYWGKMPGFIPWTDRKMISFVCPECNAVEQVTNPEYIQ